MSDHFLADDTVIESHAPLDLLQIWKGRMVNKTGPSTYNGQKRLHLKMGIYPWLWASDIDTAVERGASFEDAARVGTGLGTWLDAARIGSPKCLHG